MPELLAAAGIKVAVVSYEEWIRMLRDQDGRTRRSPLYPFQRIFLGAVDGAGPPVTEGTWFSLTPGQPRAYNRDSGWLL